MRPSLSEMLGEGIKDLVVVTEGALREAPQADLLGELQRRLEQQPGLAADVLALLDREDIASDLRRRDETEELSAEDIAIAQQRIAEAVAAAKARDGETLQRAPEQALIGELARRGKLLLGEQPANHRTLLERCRELVDGVRSEYFDATEYRNEGRWLLLDERVTEADLAMLQHELDVAVRGWR